MIAAMARDRARRPRSNRQRAPRRGAVRLGALAARAHRGGSRSRRVRARVLHRDAAARDADAPHRGDGRAAHDRARPGRAPDRARPRAGGPEPAGRALDAAHAHAGGPGHLRPRASPSSGACSPRSTSALEGRLDEHEQAVPSRARRAAGAERRLRRTIRQMATTEGRETDSGIEIKPVYTAEDVEVEPELPGEFPFTRGPYPRHVPRPAVDDPPVRRLRLRRGDERAVPLPAGARADRAVRRVRPADPARLRLGRPPRRRRGRPDRRRDRLARRHGAPLRRASRSTAFRPR